MAECERMMTEIETSNRPSTPLQGHLARVSEMLERRRQIEELAETDDGAGGDPAGALVLKQNLADLQREIDALHPADVAHILDALPPEDRLSVWHLVKSDRDGEILLEVSDAVRESLLAAKALPSAHDLLRGLPPALPGPGQGHGSRRAGAAVGQRHNLP